MDWIDLSSMLVYIIHLLRIMESKKMLYLRFEFWIKETEIVFSTFFDLVHGIIGIL